MQVSTCRNEMIKRMKSENLILKDKENGYLLTDRTRTGPSSIANPVDWSAFPGPPSRPHTSDQIHEAEV